MWLQRDPQCGNRQIVRDDTGETVVLLEDPRGRPIALNHDVRNRDTGHGGEGGTEGAKLGWPDALRDKKTRDRVHVDRDRGGTQRLGWVVGMTEQWSDKLLVIFGVRDRDICSHGARTIDGEGVNRADCLVAMLAQVNILDDTLAASLFLGEDYRKLEFVADDG